ncbi:DUF4097 family beta strand repeat-containing protein [Virgibacillus ndiopensis]|uniref:DUF4097 family beta strand repeat-containing protein n=1 Tax=Virgibacillus ndiopensis TaxID=2004408 RepID=UPI000C06F787|nr:DUF4097 family beta strand repeat-containing protein [Virgibacillus ndiopensis]
MINIKRISIIALILLLVGAIGSIITFNSINKPVSVSEEKIINTNDFTDIEIEADNEKVEIVSTDDQTTKVELVGRSTEQIQNQLKVEIEENTLSITLENEKLFNFFHFMDSNLTLKVSLPEKVYESLQVDIDNGTVYAEQLNIKAVKGETNNGHIEMEDIVATTINVESDNGKISLENVSGEINGETNNGKIYLETNDLDRPITLECDNGSIEIETENEPANATFNVRVDNGHINIFDKYSGNAVFGNGENLIKLTTNNGKIKVTK